MDETWSRKRRRLTKLVDKFCKNLSIKIPVQSLDQASTGLQLIRIHRTPLASHGQMRDDQNEKMTTGEKRI